MFSRRELLRNSIGLAGILASSKAPAFMKGLLATQQTSLIGGASLPYTRQVAWLSSDRAKYILLPSGVYRGIDIECIPYASKQVYGVVGLYNGSSRCDTIRGENDATSITLRNRMNSRNVTVSDLDLTSLVRVVVHNASVNIDGQEGTMGATWYASGYAAANPFALFGCYNTSNKNVHSPGICYIGRCIVYGSDGETPVYDFIPVRLGRVGYMYDRLGDEMFGGDGEGAFGIGPDV